MFRSTSVSPRTRSLIASNEHPNRILVDAGPIIGAIDGRDAHHENSTRGLRQLFSAQTQLLIPLPIVFEVYKRIAYTLSVEAAHHSLEHMRDAFDLLHVGPHEFDLIEAMIAGMPWWQGSLEDATLATLALERRVPLWTFNYRDFRAFSELQFWSPA